MISLSLTFTGATGPTPSVQLSFQVAEPVMRWFRMMSASNRPKYLIRGVLDGFTNWKLFVVTPFAETAPGRFALGKNASMFLATGSSIETGILLLANGVRVTTLFAPTTCDVGSKIVFMPAK